MLPQDFAVAFERLRATCVRQDWRDLDDVIDIIWLDEEVYLFIMIDHRKWCFVKRDGYWLFEGFEDFSGFGMYLDPLVFGEIEVTLNQLVEKPKIHLNTAEDGSITADFGGPGEVDVQLDCTSERTCILEMEGYWVGVNIEQRDAIVSRLIDAGFLEQGWRGFRIGVVSVVDLGSANPRAVVGNDDNADCIVELWFRANPAATGVTAAQQLRETSWLQRQDRQAVLQCLSVNGLIPVDHITLCD